MNPIAQDGYESALIGVRRTIVDPRCDPSMLYATGGLYARVVDLPASKAVSRGVAFEGDDDGRLGDELDRLKVLKALETALKFARLTGGSGIVLLADDGPVNEPMNIAAMRTIEEMRVYPLSSFAPHGPKYDDPRERNFGEPQQYRVFNGAATFIVHESRIIPVSGGTLPTAFNQTGVPWAGRDEVTRAYPAVRRYEDALFWSANILQRKQQAVYGMAGLAEMVRSRLDPIVQARINLVDSVRGVLNTVAIDAEDQYRIEDTSLGGIRDVIAEQEVAVSANTGIPVMILFGTSPGGLNATGKAEQDTYHEMVQGLQTTSLSPALERIVTLIVAQTTFQNPDNDWKIKWPPLESPSEAEAAETRRVSGAANQAEMTAMDTALGSGAMSEAEARRHLIASGMFGMSESAPGSVAGEAKQYANETA